METDMDLAQIKEEYTRIRLARVLAGRKQKDVAVAAGIDATLLSRYEHGERGLKPEVVERLRKELGL